MDRFISQIKPCSDEILVELRMDSGFTRVGFLIVSAVRMSVCSPGFDS